MYNQLVFGINEFACEPNKDRYRVIKKIVETEKSLFIDSFNEINSLEKLHVFVVNRLKKLIANHNIKCLIIHSLDSYFYTTENIFEKRKLLIQLVKNLKLLINLYHLKIIVTTTFSKGFVTEGTITNKYLGIDWSYKRNSIFTIKRMPGDNNYIRVFNSNDTIVKTFSLKEL